MESADYNSFVLCKIFFDAGGPFSCAGLVGYYADPIHCRKYYYCNKDDADPGTIAYTCTVGYLYDEVIKSCNWANHVECK